METSTEKSINRGGDAASFFQMPLHYPRYTKKDYKTMPEWQLDRLLAVYGLPPPVNGDLDCKREFSMGAFLWPDHEDSSDLTDHEEAASCPRTTTGFTKHDSSPCHKKFKIVEFLYRVLGHA